MTLSQSQQKWLFFIGLAVFLLLMSSPALASQGQGGGLPYESWLNNLRQSVTRWLSPCPSSALSLLVAY